MIKLKFPHDAYCWLQNREMFRKLREKERAEFNYAM